jgi:N-acetylmuramoyl-L-alanine amidase
MIRQDRFRAALALGLAALVSTVAAEAASKRETAAKHYRKAAQLYEDLQSVPAPELGLRQYQLVVNSLRKVHLTDPSSGYCDDSLLHLAEVYRKMAERFGEEQYRDRAVETYAFLAREYPHSKHNQTARAMAAKLGSGPGAPSTLASQPPDGAGQPPQATAGTAALSDEEHAAGEVINPSGPPAASGVAAISGIRHHSYADGTRVVLETDRKAALKYDWLKRPDRLYIDLFSSRLADSLIKGRQLEINDRLLSKARLAQNRNNKSRIVLDLRTAVSFDAFWLEGPVRLVVDVRAAGTPRAERTVLALSPAPAQAPEAPRAADVTAAGRFSLTRALGLKLERVLIDAGHGGHDTGSIGRGGLLEKDVVLDIALRLGRLVEERLAAEVIQTRTGDTFVPLEERTQIANERKADLMISIHCNSAPSSRVRGIETYYLNFTSDSWELGVAALENAAASRSIHELEDLVSKIALEEKIEESRDLATKVQARLHAGVSRHSSSIRNRGVRKAPFVVLIGAEMPAVLAEIAFMSNRADEALLCKSSFRQEVAEHLYSAIADYASSLGTLTVTRSLSAGSSQRD